MRDIDETMDGFASAERHPLEVLADEFSTALREGSNPSIAEFADRIPEQREQAVALLRSIVLFEQVSQQEDSRHRIDRTTNRFSQRRLEVLGDFKILREIGRGGMGIIYEAEQLSLKRRVALKVLGPAVADSHKQLERFRRESEAIARLHHTNIVPVFGVGTEEGVHYFAMQLIDGKPLSTPPELNFQEIARIGMQAASALTYAHEHGVLHRDIKPSNLLLDASGELWVTDFGLAKLTDGSELTQDGDIMGTLKYMAPEQLDGRSDVRTDVYALGLTLYELATHQPAFDTSKSLADRIRHHEFPKPRTINPAIPRSLETIILKATAGDASMRYQSAAEFGEDLRNFIEDRPISARRESMPERLGRWMRRNPVVAGSLAVTLLVLVATSIFSGLGYWTTQQALGEAKRAGKTSVLARDAAEKSRLQAESNLNVAIAAFDEIFDNVAKRGVPQTLTLSVNQISDDDADDQPSAAPLDAMQAESRLTTADVDLLKNLLSFYREFATQNSDDKALQSRIARAYQRSGQIQQRLGKSDEAIASYDEALKILADQMLGEPGEPNFSLAIAQILNDRGMAIFTNTEFFPAVVEHHHRAAALLKSLPHTRAVLPEIRFEIARSLDLAGSMLARRGVTSADVNLTDTDRATVGPMVGPSGDWRMPRGFGPPPGEPPRSALDSAHRLPPAINRLFVNIELPTFRPPKDDREFRSGPPRSDQPRADDPNAGRFGGRPRVGPDHSGPDHSGPDHSGPDRGGPDRGGPGGGGPGGGGPMRGGMPNFFDIARIVEAELNEASQLLTGLCQEFPDSEEYQLASAQVNRHRMQLFLFTQRGADGQAAFESARESLLRLVDLHPQKPQYLLELADTLSYASSKMQAMTAAEQEQYLTQAIDIGEQLCEAFPNVPEYMSLSASSRDKFGAFARQQERWQDAESYFSSAAQGIGDLRERFPENGFYQLSSVSMVNNLAKLYLDEKAAVGSPEKWDACRTALQAAMKSLTNDDQARDPFSDRLLMKARETLIQLSKRLGD